MRPRAGLALALAFLLGLALLLLEIDTVRVGSTSTSEAATPMAISKLLINLEYVLPLGWVWDTIHKGHTEDGGVWHYRSTEGQKMAETVEERHPGFGSVWDLACNLGFFLRHLATRHPERHYYGTDVSEVMANATKHRCPSCTTAVFDINEMQRGKTPEHLPFPVDVIVVADVLSYVSWGGWPPILNVVLPSSWTQGHRDVLWRTLTSLARREVIFSGHQHNSGVERFLVQMGAVHHGSFWVTPGTAGRKVPAETQRRWSFWKNVDPPQVLFLSLAALLVAMHVRRRSRGVAPARAQKSSQ